MASVQIDIILSRDEVNSQIPYAIICMTRYGSHWDTGKRRRRWTEEFSESERDAAYRLFSLAHKWLLTTGVPDQVRMHHSTYALWLKLGDFCASI